MSNLGLLIPHAGGVTWRGLAHFLRTNLQAHHDREGCGCLIANTELFGHDQLLCTNIADNPPKDR